MRGLFTDGWNSFSHFSFGALTNRFWWIAVLFFAYQIAEECIAEKQLYKTNLFVDLVEYGIGYFAGFIAVRAIGHKK